MLKKVFIVFILIITFFSIIFVFIITKPTNHSFLKQSPNLLTKLTPKTISYQKITPTPAIAELSLDTIFSQNHYRANQLANNKIVTLITTGDIMPGRMVNSKMSQYNNYQYPFAKTANGLKNADLSLINLEAPLLKDCPLSEGGMIFCGDYRFAEGLKYADIDIVNLANNHILNYGLDGLHQTVNILSNNNILPCGTPDNKLSSKLINKTKVGFLGFNLLGTYNEKSVLSTINLSSKKVDILVVSIHWGTEYTHFPTRKQQLLAYRIIDEGADLIVGNHPHWIQPLEVYKNKLIIYAHGNFIFDQEWSEKTKTGYIVKHTFYDNKQVDAQIFPIYISDYSQPDFLHREKKQNFLLQLEHISRDFSQL